MVYHHDSTIHVLLSPPLLHTQLLGLVIRVQTHRVGFVLAETGSSVSRKNSLLHVTRFESIVRVAFGYELLRPLERHVALWLLARCYALARNSADKAISRFLSICHAGSSRRDIIEHIRSLRAAIDDDEVVIELVKHLLHLAAIGVWFACPTRSANRSGRVIAGTSHADDLQTALRLLPVALLGGNASPLLSVLSLRLLDASSGDAAGPGSLLECRCRI